MELVYVVTERVEYKTTLYAFKTEEQADDKRQELLDGLYADFGEEYGDFDDWYDNRNSSMEIEVDVHKLQFS